ncbi:MAG: beta-N-acetylhexosaminidase [Bdellovibrionales bacterium]
MSLSLKHQIGQLMIMGLKGKSLEPDEKKFLIENNIGGVILFSRNIESPQQVHALCSEIQSLRRQLPEQAPFIISIDMEGGRVARLKAPFTVWPPIGKLGELDSTTLCFKFAETMGRELAAVGINLDFAPCVDILTNPKNVLIGDRSLGTDAEHVAKLGSAIVRGYLKSNVIACAKHFPGHGNTVIDSHEDLPVEEESDLARLLDVEMVPFKKAFRAKLDLIMTAHMKFTKVDPEWPVTLSETFLKDILREKLAYRQLVITDDLDMKALAKYYPAEFIPVQALKAGADIILYCNEHDKPPMALDAVEKAVKTKVLSSDLIADRYQSVMRLKKTRIVQPDPLSFSEASKLIGHPEHQILAQAIQSGNIPPELAT